MKSRQARHSLFVASLLLALAPLAGAQPDQRQFSSDQPMEPFPPAATEAGAPAAVASSEAGAESAAAVEVSDAAAPAAAGKPASGGDTRAWLDLQASGSAAVGAAQPMPGEVADLVYQRYLNSFKYPIPDQFRRQGGGSGSGSSGSGGSGGQGGSGDSGN
ncbi:MAG: DUF3613 domain-containing protein [Stagnimonas sp.]|nr:DUF3613 domain-containing protein [Stagnimonas sp.]